jgi:predicted Zn-dependent protease
MTQSPLEEIERLLAAGDAERARELADAALAASPGDVELESHRALALLKLGDQKGALDTLSQLVLRAPRSPSVQYHLGMALAQGRDFAHARESLHAALALLPTSPSAAAEVLYAIAMTHVAEGQPHEAGPYLERAIASDPHHVPSYAALADLLVAEEQPDRARLLLTDGVRRNPEAAELAALLKELGS